MGRTEPIRIPAELLPNDGRFGSGPSLVRMEAVNSLAEISQNYLGTSHRQSSVKGMVQRLQEGMATLFQMPDDWEILLGNGGATLFWDAATFGLIREKSQHLVFGEFSSKFSQAALSAPHLSDPEILTSEFGSAPSPSPSNVDFYALTQNETSTGVAIPLIRPEDTSAKQAIVAVDATSAAGGMLWDPEEVDCYYFSPQKSFASDGGLWIAACSPACIDRIEEISNAGRWIPAGLDLKIALENSRKNQTYNTPALSTIYLTVHQIEWMNEQGGLQWASGRCNQSSTHLYKWAESHQHAEPFVSNKNLRSPVVVTIDIDERISADTLVAACRENGILDIGGYRKIGRNQIRVATFPAIEPDDIKALTNSIDYLMELLL